ncbi:MAG: hypothetical protein WA323_27925 [Candidatus Nitrosopolaris sp.]
MRLNLIMRSVVEKGDLVYWYEAYEYGYSIKLENLHLDEYKNLLLNKLTDSLGFNMDDLRLQLSHTTISVNKFGGRSYD